MNKRHAKTAPLLSIFLSISICTVFLVFCTAPIEPFISAPSISYPDSARAYIGEPIEIRNEQEGDVKINTFDIFPELPKGLNLDLRTGSIRGTPEEPSAWRTYTIRAINDFGTAIDSVKLGVSPTAPSRINLIPLEGGMVELVWEKIPGVDSYMVYRCLEPDTAFMQIASPTDTVFVDTVGSDGSYLYAIRAFSKDAPVSKMTVGQPINLSVTGISPRLSPIEKQSINEGESFESINLLDHVEDPDTPDSLLVWDVEADWLITEISDQAVLTVAPPDSEWNGTEIINITVRDADNLQSEVQAEFTVIPVNDAPYISAPEAVSLSESLSVVKLYLPDLVHDAESPDSLKITFEAGEHLVVERKEDTLLISAADTAWQGSDSLIIRVEDPQGKKAAAGVRVNIMFENEPPVISAPDTIVILEDEQFARIDLDSLVEDNDHSDESIRWSVTEGDEILASISEDRMLGFEIPDTNWFGEDSILLEATDPLGLSAQHWLLLKVVAVNDTPTISPKPFEQAVQNKLYEYEFTLIDPDNEVSCELLKAPDGMVLDAENSLIRWTPGKNEVAQSPHEVSLQISEIGDDGLKVQIDWTITVQDSNTDPAAHDDTVSVAEDSLVQIMVLENDTDADGDTLIIHEITQKPENGTAKIIEDATIISYEPNDNYHGEDVLQYSVYDNHGGTAFATVRITVESVSDTPVGLTDVYTMLEDSTLNVSAERGVLANDTDSDGHALSAVLEQTVETGELSLNSDGSFVFSPQPNQNGSFSFTYRAEDPTGLLSEPVNVTITITPTRDAPHIDEIGDKSVKEGEELRFTVTVNDPDGDTPSLVAEGVPSWAQFQDGVFSGVPGTDDQGIYTVRFIAFDESGLSHEREIEINVEDVNLAPTITLEGPVKGRIYASDASITLTADAADPDGSVSAVFFYDGDTEVGRKFSPPYTFSTNSLGVGEHRFYAVVEDDRGERAVSDTIDIIGGEWEYKEISESFASGFDYSYDSKGDIYRVVNYSGYSSPYVRVEVYDQGLNTFSPYPGDGIVHSFDTGSTPITAEIAFQPGTDIAHVSVAYDSGDTYIRVYKLEDNNWTQIGDAYNYSAEEPIGLADLETAVHTDGSVALMYGHLYGFRGRNSFYGKLFTISPSGEWNEVQRPLSEHYPVEYVQSADNIFLISKEDNLYNGQGYVHRLSGHSTFEPLGQTGLFSEGFNGLGTVTSTSSGQILIGTQGDFYESGSLSISKFDNSWEFFKVDSLDDSLGRHPRSILPAMMGDKLIAGQIYYWSGYHLHFTIFEGNECIPFPYRDSFVPEFSAMNIYDEQLHTVFGDEVSAGPIMFIVESDRSRLNSPMKTHIFRLNLGM